MSADEDILLEKQLLSITAALGGFETRDNEPVYVPGDEVHDCLKDLKRILRREDELKRRNALETLGRWEVLQKHLLPLLLVVDIDKKLKLATSVIELLVPMTWPLTEEDSEDFPNQALVIRNYKEAFLKDNVLEKIMSLLVKVVAIPRRERSETDTARIRLILLLFRNLLAVRDAANSAHTSAESYLQSTLQEQLIIRYHEAKILEFILTIAGSMLESLEFSEWNIVMMEIIYLIFRDRRPQDLVLRHDKTVLSNALKREIQKNKDMLKSMAGRHSRFGGTLTIKHGDGAITHIKGTTTALKSIGNAIDAGKKEKIHYKRPVDEGRRTKGIVSTDAFRVLGDLADSMLQNSFNALCGSVKKDIDRELDSIKDNHVSHYIAVGNFFAAYQLLKMDGDNFDFDTVTEFLNTRGCMYVLTKLSSFYTSKKWKELHLALDCFKQIVKFGEFPSYDVLTKPFQLETLGMMAGSENPEWQDASMGMQNSIYYQFSAISTIAKLCRSFEPRKHTMAYLECLVETTHVLLKTLAGYTKAKQTIIVRKKKRARKKADDGIIAGDGDVSPDEDAKDAYVEKEFQLEEFEKEFANEQVVQTYCILLRQMDDIDEKYVKYITFMFHKIFVKLDLRPVFYRLSILNLFNEIIKSSSGPDVSPVRQELVQFIKFVVKNFARATQEYPMMFLETLFPKTRKDCLRLNGDNPWETPMTETIKISEVIILEPGLEWVEKVGIAVAVLQDDEASKGLLPWVVEALDNIADILRHDASDGVPCINELNGNSDAQNEALVNNIKLHLLLKLLDFVKEDNGDWVLRRSVMAEDVLKSKNLVSGYIENPFALPKPLEELVATKTKKRKRQIVAS